MLVKELLKHIYPSCKVRVYHNGSDIEYIAADLFNRICDSEECSDWAVYEDYVAIFI